MKHWDWAIQVQKLHAIPLYKKWHPKCHVMEIDELGINNSNFRQFDFSGLDKVLFLDNGQKIDVAQRFRRPSKNPRYEVDFSFRYKTYDQGYQDKDAEYSNFIEAYKQGHYFPNRYAFGITKTDEANGGFKIFNVYNLADMLKAIVNKDIMHIAINKNPDDGKQAIYFKLDDLEDFVVWRLKKGQCNLFEF